MTITEITPNSYRTVPEHRKLCDSVMQQAGLSPKDVARVDFVEGEYRVTVWLRDGSGKRYCLPGTNEVAKKIVPVDPASLSTPS